ncbi:hypothetical protein EXIGLDRAFT_637733 [Exidia glandulosa HHB12029]|uniref:DUF7704 domain-containing protein n=1 Tax=Exidia glandulosa HHB12029 TaxID=1314781 RepID=A0A165PCN3_EXIGL|nr:hypothetical protein EXIGLDRAFT_637733 [Exidia glandulosa HHB12029]
MSSSSAFPALPGFYQLLFLHIEPVSTITPALLTWIFPGAGWFHSELIPGAGGHSVLDDRTRMAIYQLGNCYLLLGLISSIVFRAVRDALPTNPVAQERIVGASLMALAIADVTHIAATLAVLPYEFWLPTGWNGMTFGNFPFVVFLLSVRLAWFAGIGRQTYYYSVKPKTKTT